MMQDTAYLEQAAIDSVTKFGLQTDADFRILKRVVDGFWFQQLAIEDALRELDREDQSHN